MERSDVALLARVGMIELDSLVNDKLVLGEGPAPAKGMWIGMNPGKTEVAFGRPFVGRSGRLLDRLSVSVGLRRSQFFITNVYKLGTVDEKAPTTKQVKEHFEMLKEEIHRVRPDYILAFGDVALRALTGAKGITKNRGRILSLSGQYNFEARVIGTFHPSAALREGAEAESLDEEGSSTRETKLSAMQADMLLFKRAITGTFVEHTPLIDGGVPDGTEQTIILDIENDESGRVVVVGISPSGSNRVYPLSLDQFSRWLSEHHPRALSAWNVKHELRVLRRAGCNIGRHPLEDPMLMAYAIDERGHHDLETMALRRLGVAPWKEEWANRIYKADPTLKYEEIVQYNAKDVLYENLLHSQLAKDLADMPAQRAVYRSLLLPASRVLVGIEERGIYVDKEKLRKNESYARDKQSQVGGEIKRYLGDAKIGSPDALRGLLYGPKPGGLGLPCREFTHTGKQSTSVFALKQIGDLHPLPRLLLRWRKYRKFQNTYFKPYGELLDENSRLHPSYNLLLVTGRTSSNNPNIQQVPRDELVRNVIAAPAGKVLIIADHSQQELRMLAEVSGERHMLAAFKEGKDLHTLMAQKMTGREDITKAERYRAKIPNFLFGYGGEEYMYMMAALIQFNLRVSLEEAKRDRDAYFGMWSELPDWYKRVFTFLDSHGYVETMFRRRRHLPEIWSDNQKARKHALGQGINSLVQSPSNDLTLIGAILADRESIPLVGYIHDSILAEVDEDKAEDTAALIRILMTDGTKEYARKYFDVDIKVPLVADVEIAKYWKGLPDAEE